MAGELKAYDEVEPGDLLTADLFNKVQTDIRQDIQDQITKAVGQIKSVDSAGDAQKLAGKSLAQIEQEILDKALAAIPARTGYKRIFKRLRKDVEEVIPHGLKACPLVDAYQLDYFEVVCATGDTKDDQTDTMVNFFIYHSSERRIRRPGSSPATFVDIEPPDQQPYRIHFSEMLDHYKVAYTDTTSLDDLETDFWKAFFDAPNDEFDADQYCHSPWLEKCCGERRSVAELKQRGDWDDIWFKVQPRKTVNYPQAAGAQTPDPTPAPNQLQISHFDFDTVGVKLLAKPVLQSANLPFSPDELKLMLLLKV